MAEYLILIVAGYLLIGIFVIGIMDGSGASYPKECDPVCIFFWPVLVVCAIIGGLAWGAYCIGKKIGNKFGGK